MNIKMLFNPRFTGYVAALMMGSGLMVAPPVTAQHAPGNTMLIAQDASALTGSWRLVNMTESGTPTPMVPPQTTELTAEFSGDRISGSGGCNRFMGGYQTDGGQLSIEPLASTFMACEDPILSQEIRYLQALEGAQRYEVDRQGQLTISYQTAQTSGVMRFTAQGSNTGGNSGSSTPAAAGTFQGRGVASGAAFTRGRNAGAVLTIDRTNFGLELSEPQGGRARVQYRGTVIRRDNSASNANSFTLDTRVRSFDSSASLRVITNTTGTCRIEVFDARVISSTCRTAATDSSTQFLGLEQF